VLVSTGLTDPGSVVAKWNLDSPDQWRTRILEQNDGSMPREPYQRCSQAVFEAWLKPQIQAEPLINAVFGLKFEKLTETDGGVESELSAADGEQYIVKSQYVIGCDGAGSRVRKSIGSVLEGGPV
jgi:FAD-dependent monooxygenase